MRADDEWEKQWLRDTGYWDSNMCQVAISSAAAYDCPYFNGRSDTYIPCGDECYYLKKKRGEA